jgi:membrane-bound lytic murein transglycosylase D
MRLALCVLVTVLTCGLAAANASESAPTTEIPSAATSVVLSGGVADPAVATNPSTAGLMAPSGAAQPDNALEVILEYMPEVLPERSTAETVPAIVPPRIDLWQRIRAGFAMPNLETRLSDQRTRWYAEQVDYFARMTQRSSRYLYFIVEEIELRGMPTELALLPFVESAFQAEAVSSAKAAGLWQFIPSTGRLYDLEQDMWKDERRSVIESTRAALDYLQKLYEMFGDWHLALAAYNWGEGSVSRAIEKNRRAHRGTAYTDLRMPRETQHYVPKLQAVKNIVAEPDRFGIALPPIPNSPYFVAVTKSRDMDVETAATLAGMSVDEFRELNPQFNRPVIVGAASPTLLLPADRIDAFNANLAAWEATGQPLASWTTYQMERADTLASLAKQAGISEQKLREANRIPPRYKIAPGSTILMPRDETMEDIAASSLEARFAIVPEASNLRKVTYRVRRGDTLTRVARRYRVSEKDVIVWNHLTAPKLFAGQRLELTVPVARNRVAKKNGKKSSAAAAKSAPQSTAKASAGGANKGKVVAATR